MSNECQLPLILKKIISYRTLSLGKVRGKIRVKCPSRVITNTRHLLRSNTWRAGHATACSFINDRQSSNGSAELLTLLSRSGHCQSYIRTHEIETAMCSSINDNDAALQPNVSLQNNVIYFCWDNFDLNGETLVGTDTTHSTHGLVILGPVVQSVVSLTSSFRVISLTVLTDSIYNILIFFAEKNVSSKSYSHFFSKKFQHICVSLDLNFNESLTNDVVSFEQLGPGCGR